ncbi:MAG: MoxR-like ATPase [Oceanicoccus sp.]|jgi:MoxR-like ATPase
MEEGHVAIDGINHPLSSLFTVIATQNPIDFDSTNPLPEAQLDRFLTTVSLGYPNFDDELHLLNDYANTLRKELSAIMTKSNVAQLRFACGEVFLHPDLSCYIVEMARATREEENTKLGISPRGSMHLAIMSRAYAFVKGRNQVVPEDIQCLVHSVWDHRLLPRHGRDLDSSHAHEIIEAIIQKVPVPR